MIPERRAHTQYGVYEGVPCGNAGYTVYRGIPYAKPPVGALRFAPPQEPEPFEGVRRCDTFGLVSIQKNMPDSEPYKKEFYPCDMPMGEDCLTLNVWTPAQSAGERLPVLFWIHGGAFGWGYAHKLEFDGEAFCKRGVVLVTVNYRLGTLGFLAHPSLSARDARGVSGNYGILDQIRALEWVRDNIAAFGGDPGNVTIAGQSAGGMSVQCLLVSPLAQGLYRRAAVQSGGGIVGMGPDYTLRDAESFGEAFCAASGTAPEELLTLDGQELHRRMEEAMRHGISKQMMALAPNVDGVVLPETPPKAIAAGRYPRVPILTGTVAGDGGMFGGQTPEEMRAMALALPRTWAKSELRQGGRPIYTYFFDRLLPGDGKGAFHSSELLYLFGTFMRNWRPFVGADYDISRHMTAYWANFAKSGDPNGEGLPEWPAFTAERPLTMHFNDTVIARAEDLSTPAQEAAEEKILEMARRS